jgi:hypothetical protein
MTQEHGHPQERSKQGRIVGIEQILGVRDDREGLLGALLRGASKVRMPLDHLPNGAGPLAATMSSPTASTASEASAARVMFDHLVDGPCPWGWPTRRGVLVETSEAQRSAMAVVGPLLSQP